MNDSRDRNRDFLVILCRPLFIRGENKKGVRQRESPRNFRSENEETTERVLFVDGTSMKTRFNAACARGGLAQGLLRFIRAMFAGEYVNTHTHRRRKGIASYYIKSERKAHRLVLCKILQVPEFFFFS